jgi:ABC-type uncharacterized transport system involved in gliding motility auxiliary subunit
MPAVKFLGMCITENLGWQDHICSPCHGLSKTYYVIKSFKNILSNCMLWNIYFTYFQSRLRYDIILMVTSVYVLEVLSFIKKYEGNLKQNLVIHEQEHEK